MKVVWDEHKRRVNLRKHGFDFTDAEELFSGITLTMEDDRFAYGERRFVTIGMVRDIVVVCAHAENADTVRVISMRKATRNEQTIYFESI